MIIRVEGPYYGSYSLSIVNRSLAIALSKLPDVQVWVSATAAEEWRRDEKEELNLENHFRIKYVDCRSSSLPDVVIRNTWPIEHTCLSAESKKIRYFAWEELRVPPQIIFSYNDNYDEIWAPSEFVKRALIGSGLAIPVRVVPNAVSDIYTFFPPKQKELCRFLHISSCFPRKSPDLLVQAYLEEFTGDDKVELIIKTFWNPHNTVKDILEQNKSNKANPPRVVLEESDINEDQMLDLYINADFFVFPSKGEGYGLPPEEAHAVGRPCIMPKSSSLKERFFDLVDLEVSFEPDFAATHLSASHSIWYKPNLFSLKKALRSAYEEKITDSGTNKYKDRINAIRKYDINRWDRVAAYAIDKSLTVPYKNKCCVSRKKRVCVISTFNQKCGIADYTANLLSNFPRDASAIEFHILSPFISGQDERDISDNLDHLQIINNRCWNYWGNVFDSIKKELDVQEFDHVYIQHHTGFFSPNQLDLIIEHCSSLATPCTVTLHSLFQDFDEKHGIYSEIVKSRGSEACLFFVHSLNEYKNGGSADWLFVLPQGFYDHSIYSELRPNSLLESGNTYLAASFGFMRRHKGIRELIEAWGLVVQAIPSAKLMLMNAQHSAPDSAEEIQFCSDLILKLALQNSVKLFVDHTDMETVEGVLGYIDCVIFPYLPINEGSSAAVRVALNSGAAVICSEIPLFDEFSDSVLRVDIANKTNLANAIIDFMNIRSLRENFRWNAKEFVKKNNWSDISRIYFSKIVQLVD